MTHLPDRPMTCDQLDLLLPDHIDGTLDAATRAAVEAHLAGCAACRSTVDDIAAIAAEARALPTLQPGRDLWQGIAARIEAPVVGIESARDIRASRASRALREVPRWWRTGAAAAALVAVTAGITHQATIYATRDSARSGQPVAMQPPVDAPLPGATSTVAAVPSVETPAPDSGAKAATPAIVTPRRQAATLASRPSTRASTRAPAAPLPAGAAVYDQEITSMRSVLRERRGQLDTATVRVLERNLKLIDEAITESRAALARDPESGLLADELTRAMRRKLELLRTAAAMPARST
jgi:anti-sigma factor RsiW